MPKKPQAANVPDVKIQTGGELYDQAVSSSIGSLPKLLEAYQKFGPGFSKTLNDIFVQSQGRAAEAYPELFQVLKPLANTISQRLGYAQAGGLSGTPQPLIDSFSEGLRSAQAIRGMAESPISAVTEGRELAGLAEQFRRNSIGEGLSFAGLNFPEMPFADPSYLGLVPPSLSSLTGFNQGQSNKYADFVNNTLETTPPKRSKSSRAISGGLTGAQLGMQFGGPTGAAIGGGLGALGGVFF